VEGYDSVEGILRRQLALSIKGGVSFSDSNRMSVLEREQLLEILEKMDRQSESSTIPPEVSSMEGLAGIARIR
jgi:hypothetical protein